MWLELASAVDGLGIYSAADRMAFELLVRLTTTSLYPPDGMSSEAAARISSQASGMMARFGLTPADRSRVEVKRETRDEAADFLGLTPLPGGKQ